MSDRSKALLDRMAVATFAVTWSILVARAAPPLLAAGEWTTIVLGLLVGYVLADLLAGSVHWIADRFFEPTTPLLGPLLIAPFREHHEDPLGITRHDFFEVSGNNALVVVPIVAILASLPLAADTTSRFLVVVAISATLAGVATNLFHAWAHSPSPPRVARLLHVSGLVLTPGRHARHHRGDHDRAYCVTSGWLNPILDRIEFFGRLERAIRSIAGGSRSKRRRSA